MTDDKIGRGVMPDLMLMLGGNSLVNEIDAILPQTQCGKCSFPGCKPYATAIAEGRADINQCPPGGEEGIRKLAQLLRVKPKPLNPDNGAIKPRAVAFINEQMCIGCALCLPACPVDAIVGAAKQMHTILTSECTGCELCIAPCPVNCISMLPLPEEIPSDKWQDLADAARVRYEFHLLRIEREQQEKVERLALRDRQTQ